jgi:hypothetical protein
MMEGRIGRVELDNPFRFAALENNANSGHLFPVDQFLTPDARASLGHLPIRPIFAIMFSPPTKATLGG